MWIESQDGTRVLQATDVFVNSSATLVDSKIVEYWSIWNSNVELARYTRKEKAYWILNDIKEKLKYKTGNQRESYIEYYELPEDENGFVHYYSKGDK